jgi:Zn-dependent peptidase ImmA (M78 family)
MVENIYRQAERAAAKLREELEIGNAPIKSIFKLMEEMGLFVVRMPIGGDGFSGAFFYDKENNSGKILINSNHTRGRQVFTAAHELCHYLLDKDKNIIIDNGEGKTDEEKRADCFAANFLMPKDGVENYVRGILCIEGAKIDDMALVKIKNEFGVSWSAAVHRLHALRFSFDVAYEKKIAIPSLKALNFLSAKLNFEPEEMGGDGSFEMPAEYYRLSFEAYFKNKISLGRLSELLRQSYEETREQVAKVEKSKDGKEII